MHLTICLNAHKSTPESFSHVSIPLCRCIANLRRYNPNHPLRKLAMVYGAGLDSDHHLLVAAKQFGIHHLYFQESRLSIQSLVEFCRDNTYLKFLEIYTSSVWYQDSTIYVSPHPSAVVALNVLHVEDVSFQNSTVANLFADLAAHATYPALNLGIIDIDAGDEWAKHNARLRIVANLIKPPLQQLRLEDRCPIENLNIIIACPTVTQIQLDRRYPPDDFRPAFVQQTLQAIASRNRELARFMDNPRTYPGDELLTLIREFDNNPTGRYMLARCFPAIPSFFEDQEH